MWGRGDESEHCLAAGGWGRGDPASAGPEGGKVMEENPRGQGLSLPGVPGGTLTSVGGCSAVAMGKAGVEHNVSSRSQPAREKDGHPFLDSRARSHPKL